MAVLGCVVTTATLARAEGAAQEGADTVLKPTPDPPAPLPPPAPPAPTAPPPTTPPSLPATAALDLREPPFANQDFSWLNGSNSQPEPLLKLGPVVFSVYVDAFYAWQFSQPIDHTIFPTDTAPRHNELGFNLASIGVELPPNAIDTPRGGPVGQFSIQYGTITQTIGGQDTTTNRGFYLSNTALQAIRTASAGWHFHFLHGVNLEFGIFPSYVAMESYLPQENWNYTHPFVSDFTPYYFYGGRAQSYLTSHLKLELWVVNGWQTYGQWQEAKSGIPAQLAADGAVHCCERHLHRQTSPVDAGAIRYYTDNYAQLQYFKNPVDPKLGLLSGCGLRVSGAQPHPRRRNVRLIRYASHGGQRGMGSDIARRPFRRPDEGRHAAASGRKPLHDAGRDEALPRWGVHRDGRLSSQPVAFGAP